MSEQQGRICQRGASYYTWQSGDTLQNVASANGISTQALQGANEGVDFAALAAGDVICVPAAVTTSCAGAQLYTVVRGDTLNKIAASYGVTVAQIRVLNPGVTPTNLQVGQVLCIPNANVVSPCGEGYTAKSIANGQTFASILIENDLSYYAMRQINPNVTPQNPMAGQTYCVPASGGIGTCASGRQTYTIPDNYPLGELAAVLNTTQATLLQLNPTLKPSDFVQGQIICIP